MANWGAQYVPAAKLEVVDPFSVERYEDECSESLGYDEYERQCKLREAENDAYIGEFREDLEAAGLKEKTISGHIDNVSFYLETYLTRSAPLDMRAGCYKVSDFLGSFFIRKCMWSTPSTIKSTAASFKKFYKSMLDRGHILQSDFDFLLAEIKEDLPYWCDLCEEYNDPHTRNPFSPFGDDLYGPLGWGEEGDDPDPLSNPSFSEGIREAAEELLDMLRSGGMDDDEILGLVSSMMGQLDELDVLLSSDDATLCGVLEQFGLPGDRAALEACMRAQPAEDYVVEALCDERGIELSDDDADLAFTVIGELWERWLPDKPSEAWPDEASVSQGR